MCNHISSAELWDHIYTKLSLPFPSRGKRSISFKEKYGDFNLNHFSTGSGINYTAMYGNFIDDTIIENLNSSSSSFFCFNTGNSVYMEDKQKNKKVKWDSNVCWNGEISSGHTCNSLYSKNKPFTLHHIAIDNTLFKELTHSNTQFSDSRLVYQGNYIDVKFNNQINNHQKKLLSDLFNLSSLDSKLHELYLESKLLDLIYTSVNAIDKEKKKNTFYLSQQDIHSLHKAKDILIENMNNPPSLKELAYKSAINEFKLKKGFKQLFGNTVYGFLQEHRLNVAKSLLENNEINIGEASFLVGYKSISHFSKIFKDHFGITPIEIKKENRSYYC